MDKSMLTPFSQDGKPWIAVDSGKLRGLVFTVDVQDVDPINTEEFHNVGVEYLYATNKYWEGGSEALTEKAGDVQKFIESYIEEMFSSILDELSQEFSPNAAV